MPYTVKQLAQLSGVSVRTLHHYDQIGLLKPAYTGANGYRYYEEEQLLLLQQILLFREMGFELAKIKKIINRRDFDRLGALKEHRKVLEASIVRTKKLIETVDNTIKHLQGQKAMEAKEFFQTFRIDKRGEDEQYMIERGGPSAMARIEEAKKRVATWKDQDYLDAKEEGEAIQRELAVAMRAGLAPSAPEVQGLMRRQYQWLHRYYTPNREVFLGHAEMFQTHPEYRAFYNKMHPGLADFIADAIRLFVEAELS